MSAIGLLRRSSLAGFAFPMLIWLFLTSVGVFAAFVISAQGGTEFATGPAVMVGGVGVVTAVLAGLVLRPTGPQAGAVAAMRSPAPSRP